MPGPQGHDRQGLEDRRGACSLQADSLWAVGLTAFKGKTQAGPPPPPAPPRPKPPPPGLPGLDPLGGSSSSSSGRQQQN